MKAGTTEKLKFLKLQKALGQSKRGTVGLLELLWCETAKNAPRGDIGKLTDEEIALLCDWDGAPVDLITALVQTGWLDECEVHRLVVHDWAEHCPTFIKGSLAKWHKQFAFPVAKQDAKYSAKHDAKHVASELATPPSNLLPILSKPTNSLFRNSGELLESDFPQKEKPKTAKPQKPEIDPAWFQEWWDAYGKKTERQDCLKLFPEALAAIAAKEQLSLPAAFEWLLAKTRRWVVITPDKAYRKNPDKWLRKKNYFDEFESSTANETPRPQR